MYEEKVFSEFGFKNIPLNFGDILTKSEKIKTPALKKLFFVAGVFHMPLLRNFRISGVA